MKKLLLLSALLLGAGDNRRPLVVHEWGTFTSVAGADGVALDWRPLSGPSDLPGFVYRDVLRQKGLAVSRVRMETPVLYFYSDREIEASVKVGFPKGRITEWYPSAVLADRAVSWPSFKIMPGSTAPFPKEPAESHYYPARETDAVPVRVGAQAEKFLFYRGVGTFALPIQATLQGRRVGLQRTGRDAVSQAILFENSGGRVGWRILGRVSAPVDVERPVLDRNVSDLHLDLEAALVREGLYEKEARAMVKTWKDSWFEEGLRVFYMVPPRVTEEVLPLTMTPRPAELVRVLVGRAELITPEEEARVAEFARRLPDREAKAELLRRGRFAEPALRRVAASDAGLRPKIDAYFRETSTAVIRP